MIRLLVLLIPLLAACSPEPQWSESELAVMRSLSLTALPPLPNSPSNRVANNPEAAALGRAVFFDPRFSGNGQLSCASCHQPDQFFTDQRPRGVGIKTTQRNTPTLVASGWLRWFYWDGRRDSLWSQALIPFEAGEEMGGSRAQVVWQLGQAYRESYEKIFGDFPKTLLTVRPSAHASPIGDAAMQNRWYRMPKSRQQSVNTVFANLGKAIAAYERTLQPKPTRFDRFVAEQQSDLLNDQEKAGLKLFIDPAKTNCLQCHNGPLLTNQGFHNIGSGNFDGQRLDFGRVFGVQALLLTEFNCLGPYSDAKPEDCTALRFLQKNGHLEGAFKTPSLRNLKKTAPYFHDGRFQTLQQIIEFYTTPPSNNGPHELKALTLSAQEQKNLVAFLSTLNN